MNKTHTYRGDKAELKNLRTTLQQMTGSEMSENKVSHDYELMRLSIKRGTQIVTLTAHRRDKSDLVTLMLQGKESTLMDDCDNVLQQIFTKFS